MPTQLANLSPEPTLIAGPVTVVGKVVRVVRNESSAYIDNQSLATFAKALGAIDVASNGQFGYVGELSADAVVFDPGAVILPIAIYK
jgi:hypothetical protein